MYCATTGGAFCVCGRETRARWRDVLSLTPAAKNKHKYAETSGTYGQKDTKEMHRNSPATILLDLAHVSDTLSRKEKTNKKT